jgi:predicted O-methyltransferase YrrM
MSQERWTEVDRYITGKFLRSDPGLDGALRASAEAGLPPINVSPPQGMLLMLLARAMGAQRILEIGTLGGYSTIWLARALPAGGLLTTLELDPKHAKVAAANIRRAGLSRVVEIRQGPALETLPKLQVERKDPFDLFFIDADKPSNADYFAWAVKLSRPGSLIIVDNVIRDGAVVDARSRDPDVGGVQRLNDMIAAEPRVIATEIQTVGSKGYDGFAMALVVPLAKGKM